MRKSDAKVSTAVSAIPSQELLWVRDESSRQTLEPIPLPSHVSPSSPDVNEVEDGEIVEEEVTGIVDLLAESMAAVRRSQSIIDLSLSPIKKTPKRSKLFYEDRTNSKFGSVPRYRAFGESSANDSSISDDVIILDSSQPDNDDSVIFVSEEKVSKLSTPDCLKSPVVHKLLNFVPSQPKRRQRQQSPKTKRKVTPARKERVKKWHDRKTLEFASKKHDESPKNNENDPMPSTSAELTPPAIKPDQPPQREKRIVLLDGSNIAMEFTDSYGERKTDKDFSAEGND